MGEHHEVVRVGGCAGIPFQLFVSWRLLGVIDYAADSIVISAVFS